MHVRTGHMLPEIAWDLRQSWGSGLNSTQEMLRSGHPLQLHRVAPKNDVPVPLRQEISTTCMPSVLWCCWHISPHVPTVVTCYFCMIAVNIPVYIDIWLCVCSAGVHDTISMCYIGRRDVSHVCFSANVSQPTAQPQQEKWNHHPSSRIIYKLYIFIHKCKKWFANCVETQVKRMTW